MTQIPCRFPLLAEVEERFVRDCNPPPFSLEKQLLFWTIRKSTRNARISAGSEPGKGLENERHNLRERLYCRFSPVPGSAVPFGDLRGTRTQTLRRACLLQRGRLDVLDDLNHPRTQSYRWTERGLR